MAKGASISSSKSAVLLMFMWLFIFMLNFHSSQGEEVKLVLSFKASIHDPLHFLSNWVINSSSSTTLCNWHGITCDNSSHVNAVILSAKNISGEISSSIFELPYITNLDLSNNQLIGEITFNFNSSSSLSPLRYLNLSNNNLTGSLPQSLFSVSFSHLESLDLSNNMFSGNIPEQIGLLSSMRYLDIGGNVLVGKIPNSITNLTTNLQYLTLASNQLVGEIPQEIGLMKSLKWIYFGYNNLSGEIPKSIGELFSLNHLDLVYNNLTGSIPESLGYLTHLQYLFLYRNNLSGQIPLSIFELRNLVSLDLSDNSLSGEISELVIQLQRLEILHLFSNRFTGKIPKALASLPKLQVLQMWSNKLTGEIPEELGKHNNLTVLDLSSNNLTGKIPDTLCDSGNLFKLILFSNSLEGEIPKSLSSCTSLHRVRLQNNKLSGSLPSQLTKLPHVYLLDISGNQLSGRIDDRKWDMKALQMLSLANNNFSGNLPNSFGSSDKLEDLDLSNNQFSGYIPYGYGRFWKVVQLKLSNNNLFGNIPEELCFCKKLVALDLSNNHLSGQIPVKLAELPVLGLLDLSENQLSGEIPQNLGSVESLVQVNISHNHFHGILPSTGVFLAINASAVSGTNLCDTTSRPGLPPCKSDDKNPTWLFILLCFLVGFVALTLASFLIVFVRKRRRNLEVRRVENEDGTTWEIQFFDYKASKMINMDDVLSSAKEGKVISKGRSFVSYEGKCIGQNNEMQFVVIEMNDPTSLPLSFWEDTAKFGKKVKHPNIIKLIGTCRSGKRGYYLMYDYSSEGQNLSEILSSLSWERRWKIAVGIAKALKFLHCHCSSIVLVGEVSPEIVLVDGKGVPRLKVTPPGMTSMDVKAYISSPYLAPEARKMKDVTEKSAIYGFGVMLIGLLTGRSSMDTEAGNGMHQSIVEWARYCYSDCHVDTWIDPAMKGVDASTHQKGIVETMNLALHCTATDPTARPCASDVLKAMEDALSSTPTFC